MAKAWDLVGTSKKLAVIGSSWLPREGEREAGTWEPMQVTGVPLTLFSPAERPYILADPRLPAVPR